MENLIQRIITIYNGNLTYFNLYFVYVLAIFQNIHKCFDTLIKILKHTHNIFTTALKMGFMKIIHYLLFLLKAHQNRLKYSMFWNINVAFLIKQSPLIHSQYDK